MTYNHMMIFRTGKGSAKFETSEPVDQTHDAFRAEIEARIPGARFEAGTTRAADRGIPELWAHVMAQTAQAPEEIAHLMVHKMEFSWEGSVVSVTGAPTLLSQDAVRERVLTALQGARFLKADTAAADPNLLQVMQALAHMATDEAEQDPNGAAAEGQP